MYGKKIVVYIHKYAHEIEGYKSCVSIEPNFRQPLHTFFVTLIQRYKFTSIFPLSWSFDIFCSMVVFFHIFYVYFMCGWRYSLGEYSGFVKAICLQNANRNQIENARTHTKKNRILKLMPIVKRKWQCCKWIVAIFVLWILIYCLFSNELEWNTNCLSNICILSINSLFISRQLWIVYEEK